MDGFRDAPSNWRSRQPAHRNGQASGPTQIWTASRCRRLLRPLVSHIAALRKQIAREQSESSVQSGSVVESGSDSATGLSAAGSSKVRQTYSRRRKNLRRLSELSSAGNITLNKSSSTIRQQSRRRTALPGEVVLPTPVLKRARGHQVLSPVPQPAFNQDDSGRPKKRVKLLSAGYPMFVRANLEDELIALRISIPASQYSLYESLFRSFEALLRATTDTAQSPASNSLLAMCLRKMPYYIGELEFWEQKDAEESGNKSALQQSEIPDQVYAELESLGPGHDGWKHLTTVVRSHGIKVIKDAINEGLLDLAFLRVLVMLCSRSQCYAEGEDLIEAMVDRQYPKPRALDSTFDDTRRLAALRTLRDFSRECDRPQILHKHMAALLRDARLPSTWLTSKEFRSIWSSAARSISGSARCPEAISFTVQSITLLCRQDLGKTQPMATAIEDDVARSPRQTLISVLTALISMAMLSHEADANNNSPTERVFMIAKRVKYLIQACLKNLSNGSRKNTLLAKYFLTLAEFFIPSYEEPVHGHAHLDVQNRLETLCQALLNSGQDHVWKQVYDGTVSMVCSIAHCCGRGASLPSHSYLLKLCKLLDTISVPGRPFRKLESAAAFSLAERTNDLRDLAYAEALRSVQREGKTPTSQKSAFSGFRWEEGISGKSIRNLLPICNNCLQQLVKHMNTTTCSIDCSGNWSS